ncbi:ISL3 family transposase [Micromonospora sp. NPDC023814]|uniref:ISL3 family transposase n=1 Tax=Micromonospora sp. NPDC023814 TaxID=3154596 RepID=UPI0033E769C6
MVRAVGVRIDAATRTVRAACGVCGVWSSTVHGRYTRRLADVRLGGHEVLVALTVRRFTCGNSGCQRRTFVEQVPGLTRRYARHTVLAAGDLEAVAVALGGRPGSRLAQRLAVSVSRTTLIRVIRRIPDPPVVTPTVLGVDDFARRRGHRYATVLLDMHTRRPIDVLPDRTADTLAEWLREHPGVEIICRDRGGAYAEGARQGAPNAIQVADRWHLLKNLSDVIEKVIRGHRRCLKEPADPVSSLAAPVEAEPVRTGRRAVNTRERHAAVHALRAEGLSIKATARRLDMNVRTARKYAHATTAEMLIGPNASSRPSILAPFHPYLRQRLTDGIHQTAALAATTPTTATTAAIYTLRLLAQRIAHLNTEIRDLEAQITAVVTAYAPQLLQRVGVGPDSAAALLITIGDNPERMASEASFAALCGASPVEASSGKTQRRRLNRGGDRQANAALYRIVLTRLRWDPHTRTYLDRRISDGKSRREAIRCLKRYVARELYPLLRAASASNDPAEAIVKTCG